MKERLSRAFPLSLLLLLLGVIFYPFLVFLSELPFLSKLSPFNEGIFKALSFGFQSAGASALISLPLASGSLWLLNRSHVSVRTLVLVFLFIPSGIAAIVSTLSLLIFFGRQGLLNHLLELIGSSVWDSRWFYSYPMILLLNVLYNVPLVTLVFWGIDQYFPVPLMNKARALGAGRWAQFRSIVLPLWRPHLLAGFSIAFVFCFVSFFPVLFLGSKGGYTTPEVLIYSKVSVAFSVSAASQIALLQSLLLWGVLSLFLLQKPQYTPYHAAPFEPSPYPIRWWASLGSLGIAVTSTLLWAPLFFRTLSFPLSHLEQSLGASLPAFRTSLLVGLLSGFFTVSLAAWITFQYRPLLQHRRSFWLLFLPFTFSPLLTSFLYQRSLNELFDHPSPILSLVLSQVVLGLPFVLYLLSREFAGFQSLPVKAALLGARGWHRWRTIDLPLFKQSYLRIFFMSLVTSLGNLSTGLLYLPKDFETIPLRISRLLGFYRLDEAVIVATFFVFLFFALLALYRLLVRWL